MISVDNLFREAGILRRGAVRWGTAVSLAEPGIYAVSTSERGDVEFGLDTCPLDLDAVASLLAVRPEATIDGQPAQVETLSERLCAMWVPGNVNVYVGLAGTSVQNRVNQFYRTAIGARAPHAGGWPVKMLRTEDLWVHFGPCVDPKTSERRMLKAFMSSVSAETREGLVDPVLPLPFANLELNSAQRKRHGLAGVKARRGAVPEPTVRKAEVSGAEAMEHESGRCFVGATRRTQNITAGDIVRGSLRVPASAKDIFPEESSEVIVEFAGDCRLVSWNPRTSGGVERSGIIGLGREDLSSLSPRGPMRITRTEAGYLID